MSVYVGIDVHRKRSQVAVIDQDGQVLANRNVNNGVTPILSVIGGLPPDAVAAVGMETLTNREREVVALVAHGLSNDEIADAMVLSPATAKTHVSRAMIKLGARDRAQLVVFAYQTGLVTPRAAG